MTKSELIKALENKAKDSNRYKIGHDGTRFYLISLEEIQEIIEVLEGEENK